MRVQDKAATFAVSPGDLVSGAGQVPCPKCPLRRQAIFRNFTPEELDFVWSFKRGELRVDRGASILLEGSHNPHLYTVLTGWGFRYKLMPDGRRQIVNFILPGDLVGLQGSIMGEMQHSVEALTGMTLCVFERSRLMDLYVKQPTLAYDVTWIASREECILDENLLTVGRRNAMERIAYLAIFLSERARDVGILANGSLELPLTQQHVADTLGMSLVHTNKTIRKLVNRQLLAWRDGGCTVLDMEGLQRLARWESGKPAGRPFI